MEKSLIGTAYTPADNSYAYCIDEVVPTNHSLAGTTRGDGTVNKKPVECEIVSEPFKIPIAFPVGSKLRWLDFVVVLDLSTGLRSIVLYHD